MIGNVNVPGASAADIASVSSIANEALNKANQALNSGVGSESTELNMELSSAKYYPPPGFMNIEYKDGYYLVAVEDYLYYTSDLITWNRTPLPEKANKVYLEGDMIICIYVSDTWFTFNTFDTQAPISYTLDNIGQNMTWYNTYGIIAYDGEKYINQRIIRSSTASQFPPNYGENYKTRISLDGITWTDTAYNSITNYGYPWIDDNSSTSKSYNYMPFKYNGNWYTNYYRYSSSTTPNNKYIIYSLNMETSDKIAILEESNTAKLVHRIKYLSIDGDLYFITHNDIDKSSTYNCKNIFNIRRILKNNELDSSFTYTMNMSTSMKSDGVSNYTNFNNVSLIGIDNEYLFAIISNIKSTTFLKINKTTASASTIEVNYPFSNIADQLPFDQFDKNRKSTICKVNNRIFFIGDFRAPLMEITNITDKPTFIPIVYSYYITPSLFIDKSNDNIYIANENNGKILCYSSNNGNSFNVYSEDTLIENINYIHFVNNHNKDYYHFIKNYIPSTDTDHSHDQLCSYYQCIYFNNNIYRCIVTTGETYTSSSTKYTETYFQIYENSTKIFGDAFSSLGQYDSLSFNYCIKNDSLYILIGRLKYDYNVTKTSSGYLFTGTYLFKIDSSGVETIIDASTDISTTEISPLKYFNLIKIRYVCDMIKYKNKIYTIGPEGSIYADNINISKLPIDYNAIGLLSFKDKYLIAYNNDYILYSADDGFSWKSCNCYKFINGKIKSIYNTSDHLFIIDDNNIRYTFAEIE